MKASNSEPVIHLDQDRYKLSHAAFYLSKVLQAYSEGGVDQMGQVLAINGDWGSGKTSLVELLRLLFEGVRSQEKSPEKEQAPKRWARGLFAIGKTDEKETVSAVTTRPLKTGELKEFLPVDVPNEERAIEELANLYDATGKRIRFVEFDAWTGASSAEILISMIDEIVKQLKSDGADKFYRYNRQRFLQDNGQSLVNGARAMTSAGLWAISGVIPNLSSAAGLETPELGKGRKLEEHVEQNCKFIADWLRNDSEAKGGRQIVLVVDDIDRMPPDRIEKLILSLRWLRVIPRLTVIMIFDHALVVDGLARTLFSSGDSDENRKTATRYLEKIIQFTFDVPRPRPAELFKVFEERIRHAQPDLGHPDEDRYRLSYWLQLGDGSGAFEEYPRWTQIKRLILQPLLITPRAVSRLAEQVNISWAMRSFQGLDGRDFIAVEALKMFRPDMMRDIVELHELDENERQNRIKDWNANDKKEDDDPKKRFLSVRKGRVASLLFHDDKKHSNSCGFYQTSLLNAYLYGSSLNEPAWRVRADAFFRTTEEWQKELERALERKVEEDLFDILLSRIAEIESDTARNEDIKKLLKSLDWASKKYPAETKFLRDMMQDYGLQ